MLRLCRFLGMPAFGLLLALPAAAWQACPAALADSQSGGIVRYVATAGAAKACANGLAPCRPI
ncbi:MAG: hypothetical protein Q8O07_06800 [Chloroflexota bacterium]|nr:hypothetical protein [Chloroflexota bacterium]